MKLLGPQDADITPDSADMKVISCDLIITFMLT